MSIKKQERTKDDTEWDTEVDTNEKAEQETEQDTFWEREEEICVNPEEDTVLLFLLCFHR